MKFSIIIPIHNAADRIHVILSQIKAQSFKDYEVICVCDSCIDNSAQICDLYADVMNVKTVNVSFGNDGLTRSRGIDMAKGDWLLFVDDDDEWISNEQLEQLSHYLDDDIDIVAMSFKWQMSDGTERYCRPLDNSGFLFPNVWSKCFRREFVGDIRFPNVYSVSDSEFCQMLDKKEPRYRLIDLLFYRYKYREGSISAKEKWHDQR